MQGHFTGPPADPAHIRALLAAETERRGFALPALDPVNTPDMTTDMTRVR